MQPHANLTFLHFCLFAGAMASIAAWGLAVLEADLAREAGAILVVER